MQSAGIYLLEVNNRNTRTRCKICSELTIPCSSVSIVNFEHVIAGWVHSTSGGNLAPLHLKRTETMRKPNKVSDIF